MGNILAEAYPVKGSFLCKVKDGMFKSQRKIHDVKWSFSVSIEKA